MSDDEQYTPEELATLFGEPVPVEVVEPFPEETIFAIAARVKNQATLAVGENLTPVGVALCNSYTHVLKSLYGFSHSLPEEDRLRLNSLLRSHEGMPSTFIVATFPAPQKPSRPRPTPTPTGGYNIYVPKDEGRPAPLPVSSDGISGGLVCPELPKFLHRVVNWFLN